MTKAESSDLPCRLIVDRASVSMGDDVAAHSEVWQLPGSTSIAELLTMMAKQFLPRVAGFAGWRVYQDLGERGPGWPLGLIYTRDHLREERFVCLESQYLRTVDELAQRAPVLVVQAAYLNGQAARPVWLSEVEAGPSFSGVELIRAAVDDGSAGRDWRTLRLLDSLAAEREGPRRAWIREHVLAGGLAAAELFAARNMGALAADLCPASMALAASDLLCAAGEHEDVFAALGPGQAALGVVATAFGAGEWGLSRGLRRRPPPRHGVVYLEYLAGHGYPLAPIEQYIAGHIDFDELASGIATDPPAASQHA
jgi:hypothetical protein